MPAPRTTTAPVQQTTAILAIICISYFMVILDNSIIFTGLPRIQAAMGFSPAGLTWVQDAYTLVFGGLLLLGARAGDICSPAGAAGAPTWGSGQPLACGRLWEGCFWLGHADGA